MVDAEVNNNVGRRLRLIRRDPNGQNTLLTGTLVAESHTSYTRRTDRGEERTEPKFYCSVEWLSPVQSTREGAC